MQRKLILLLLALTVALPVRALHTNLLQVETSVTTTTPSVTITWDPQTVGANVQIYRRALGLVGASGGNQFTLIDTVAHPVTTYTDTGVESGAAYEYRIARPAFTAGSTTYNLTSAYVAVSIDAALVDERGTVLLVVDTGAAAALPESLAQLELDLAGDGWNVVRLEFAPEGLGTPVALKNAILAARDATPSINALYLFGRLPVARSGMVNPDGHTPLRAHETDLYYADLNGSWTDSTINVASSSFNQIEEQNIPGDGKFDQSNLPSAIELMTGRVDFSRMSAYRKNEYELLRDYIAKSHAWRHQHREIPHRGLIAAESYLFMEHNWLRPMFGQVAATSASLQPELSVNAHIWAVDFGYYDGADESNYTSVENRAAFFLNFGSYKQHWNRANNPMRGLLAQPDWGLTAAWGARPAWHMHHMAAGYPVGYSALRSINNYFNTSEYLPTGSFPQLTRYVSQNLMGDPTLRQHQVLPVTTLSVSGSNGTANLAWNAPADNSRVGYHVYRSTSRLGPYARLTGTPLPTSTNTYQDSFRPAGDVYYQVRSIARTSVPTGSYLNQSQGMFALLRADHTANEAPTAVPPATLIAATGVPVPVTFPGADANGDSLEPIILTNPAHGALRWNGKTCVYVSNLGYTGADSFTYRLSDGINLGPVITAAVEVDTTRDNVLLGWEFASPASGAAQSPDSTRNHHLVQPAQLSSGPGATRSTLSAYNDDAYHLTGVNSTALDANDWIGWTVSPVEGARLDLDSLVFFAAAGGDNIDSPPATCDLELRVSTDNFATHSTVPLTGRNGTTAATLNARTGRIHTADLTTITALQAATTPVQFRLYIWNTANFAIGKSQDNNSRVIDDLVVFGDTSYVPPVADAGPDATVTDGPYDIELDGTTSLAPGATYAWTRLSGPDVTLGAADTATALLPADTAGTYVLRLTVTNPGGSDTDTVTITITPGDEAPVVNAGQNQSVSINSSVQLAATAVDYDGDELTLLWTQLSGPDVILLDAQTATASFTGTRPGTYVFSLSATANGVITTDTVSVTVNPELTLHYAFDEGAGTTIGDTSGNAVNRTVTNVAGLTWTASGRLGSAYDISSNGFFVPDTAGVIPAPRSQSFTLSAWVRITSASSYRYILELAESGNTQLQLRLWSPASSIRVTHGNGVATLATDTQTSSLTDGQWHLLTLVNFNDNGTWKTRLYYDDGTHFVEFPTGAGAAVATDLRLGGDMTGVSYNRLPGHLDEVRAYNRALSTAEITALYNGTAPSPAGEPEIAVLRASASIIQSSTDTLSGTRAGESAMIDYAVANIGGDTLTLEEASLSAATNLTSAAITTQPGASLAPNTTGPLSLAVTPAAAGPWSVTITLPNSDADEAPATWTISGTAASPQTGYAAWAAAIDWAGADSAPAADANADGVANLLAYALALPAVGPPVAPAQLPRVALDTSTPGGPWLSITYRRHLAATDIAYDVLSSETLIHWSTLVADGTDIIAETVDPDADGDGRTELRRMRVKLPASPSRLFLRLRVTP